MECSLNPLYARINDFIPDDAMCVTFIERGLVLNEEGTVDEGGWHWELVKRYVESLGTILFSTAGLHKNGERKVPHIHYAFVLTDYKEFKSDPGKHRAAWCKKNKMRNEFPVGNLFVSKYVPLEKDKPKFQVLSYPLKEGCGFEGCPVNTAFGEPMKKEYYEFFKDVGRTIYDKELAARERRDKSDERQKNSLKAMADYAKTGLKDGKLDKFHNISQLRDYVEGYLDTLEMEKLPTYANYMKDIHAIGKSLKVFKYSQL